MLNKTLMASMMAAFSLPLMAANPDVKGSIVDENGEPMGFVNVVLLSLPDSSFVQGATSNVDGLFNIETPAVQGLLRVSSIGYETQYLDTRNFAKGDIKIQMRQNNQLLNEVTVKAQLPKTKLTGNSMVTSIEGSVLEKSGTAKEMLAKVPGMTLKNDELEVLGKGTPVFYVNGRKVTDKDELKRLRSEEIQNVEVITNPGAMYDATVTAVVRIKTRKQQGSGFGYDLSTGVNQHLQYENTAPNANLNLRYRHNNLDLFGSVNYWKWDNPNVMDIHQNTYFKSGDQISRLEQQSSFRNYWHGQGMNYTMGFNWQIADQHSVGMRVERHDNFKQYSTMDEETSIAKYLWEKTRSAQNSENELTRSHQKDENDQDYNWEGNTYYNGKVGKLGIDLNVDFMTTKSTEVNHITDANASSLTMKTLNPQESRMIAQKLVLSYPVWKGNLEVGTEMSFVRRKSINTLMGLNLPSSSTEVKEKNMAAFAQYGCNIPNVGNVSLGVRYEHVGFDYTDRLDEKKNMTRYTDDIFPSASWSQQFGDWQTAVSYSFKTNRPAYWNLSDTYQYVNAYSLMQGDPQLKNEKTQDVSATIRWKWINLYTSYQRTDNRITQWSYIFDNQQAPSADLKNFGEGTILIKHTNMKDPVRKLSMYLSASPTFGCYSPNWSVGFTKYDVKLELADPRMEDGKRNIHFNKPIGMADFNNAFRFKKGWQLEANYSVMTSGDYTNFHFFSPSTRLQAVVQKCWLKNDALCLRASVSDIFKRGTEKIRMDCGYYELNQVNLNTQHRLDVSVRYTFNATQSKYKGTGAGSDTKNRF